VVVLGAAAIVIVDAVAMGAGCSGGSPGAGDAGGGRGGIAGTGGSGGGGRADSGAVGGAAGEEPPASCVPPAEQGGPTGVELELTSTWCDGARSCATCVWDVIETVPTLSGRFAPVTTTCAIMPIACPAPSGATAASSPSCSYRPDAGRYDGALVTGYPTASDCKAINSEVVGLSSFPFGVVPCTLDAFVCVADCSSCPSPAGSPGRAR